jgi:3-hydroxymyristoyl/3-hydroxydecanoyl-(acyl carrier protein) dehydratase
MEFSAEFTATEFTARLVVPHGHPSFAGHFPGHPIVPGVVLLDLIVAEIQTALKQPVRLIAIPSTKFQRPVLPAEPVDVTVRVSAAEQPDTVRARFQITSQGAPVTEGHFLLGVVAA